MEEPSGSGLKPRQLEAELGGTSGSKRRAAAEEIDHEDFGPSNPHIKRPRAVSIGVGTRATATPAAAGLPPPRAGVPATAPAGTAHTQASIEERPDVFAYFAERSSRRQELERQVERLLQREGHLDRRLKDAELHIDRLKSEATAASARHEAREAQLNLQRQQLEDALRAEVGRTAGLESKLRSLEAGASSGRQAALASSPGAGEVSEQGQDEAPTQRVESAVVLKHRVEALELEVQRAKSDAAESARQADARMQDERRRRGAAEASVAALQQRLDEAAAEAHLAADKRRQAEARSAQLEAEVITARASSAAAKSSEGDAVLVRSLREQLRKAQTTAAEATRLRTQASEAAVLRERLEVAEARARRAEGALQSEEAVHAELATAQAELERWKALLSGVADCSTPEDVLRMVQRLQGKQIEAAAADGIRGEAVAEARANAEAAAAAMRQAEANAAAQRTRAEAAEAALERANRKVELVCRERDGLKSVLSTYDEEYLAEQGADISREQRRIAELEATVDALHRHIASLEANADGHRAAEDTAQRAAANAEAVAQVEAAEAQARAAKAEIEALQAQVASLEHRVARGEYNPETTKVLHLRNNPEAELQRAAQEARLAELEAENAALRQNIMRLEAATGGDAGVNQPGGIGGGGASLRIAQLEGESNLLRRRLSEAQKSSDRLQQVFTRQISTFREAVAGLFGYRVEMTSDPSVRDIRAEFVLRPLKADEAGAELAFRLLRDGRLVLAPTEYSRRRLAREVETFVDRFRSIPALTANLTMENFQRQTQA